MTQYISDATALINHDAEGWKIEYPVVTIMRDEGFKTSSLEHSPEAAQVEILKIRF